MPAQIVNDRLRIYLTHPDYASDHLKRAMFPFSIIKRPSIETLLAQNAVMVMRKGESIEGRVIDKAGRPIPGVPIYDEKYYWFDSRKPAATTGEDGRFRIPHVKSAKTLLTVQASGYAPELIETDTTGSDSPLEILLKPGQAVQGRVVDESGKPVEGVSVSPSLWRGHHSRLNLTTTTDADGRFRLTDAPLDGAQYRFYKKGYMSVAPLPMSPPPKGHPGGEDFQVTLKPPLWVVGSIVDAETNRPLAKCTVIKGWDYDNGLAPEWRRLFAKTITDGRYEFEFSQEWLFWRIRIEAEGYMPAVSRVFKPYNPDKGRVTYDFKLKNAAAPLTGTVLGTDGKPLADAKVFLTTEPFTVKDRKASYHSRSKSRMVRTDAAGRFEFPSEVEPFYLVALHDQGYAKITEEQFADSAAIRIQPWTDKNKNFRAQRRNVNVGQAQRLPPGY